MEVLAIVLSYLNSVYVFYACIGAGTSPAGPAMAGPFSAEVET